MGDKITQIKALLGDLGREIEQRRMPQRITSTADIDRYVPTQPGVYWIETTMPVDLLQEAISNVLGKWKKIRQEPPEGAKLIHQTGNTSYIVYSGTEDNINNRLKQHLFNQGSSDTAKLGCIINEQPFSNYEWKVSSQVIGSYEIRYAVEAWWRLNVGWPLFCIR